MIGTMRRLSPLLGALLALPTSPIGAQVPTADTSFIRTNAKAAMRDGVHLNTDVYVPKHATGPLPILFLRTPYGISNAARRFQGSFKELASEGYIFAFQDIRGRYQSEGQFVMQRALHDPQDAGGVDESTDAYDTID